MPKRNPRKEKGQKMNRVAKARKYRNIPSASFCDMCGLTPEALKAFESQLADPSGEEAEKMGDALEVDPEYIADAVARRYIVNVPVSYYFDGETLSGYNVSTAVPMPAEYDFTEYGYISAGDFIYGYDRKTNERQGTFIVESDGAYRIAERNGGDLVDEAGYPVNGKPVMRIVFEMAPLESYIDDLLDMLRTEG